ncbi:MAG TPA: phycocyanin operon protein Y [Cyanobacteria bacterium UBA8156]|jgi:bilin biosynthesis protein|nr:phycocyanin operon protein Y [Cyanobacteria bacterium UBA8156]
MADDRHRVKLIINPSGASVLTRVYTESWCIENAMTDKRFFKLYDLSEEAAIALLDTPEADLAEGDSRYVAASHLVNFNTPASIAALIRAVERTDPSLDNRIVRRKALESLGRLQVQTALPTIAACLTDEDPYTVENAVWALAELGTTDPTHHQAILAVLGRPQQSYRVVLRAIGQLGIGEALPQVQPFCDHEDPLIASAAIATVLRLGGDRRLLPQLRSFLRHPHPFARRLAIQDCMDVADVDAVPEVVRCPVSLVFRMRGVRHLAMVAGWKIGQWQEPLEAVLRDRPETVAPVHTYAETPSLEFLIQELFQTDFGKCYLASQWLLQEYAAAAPAALRDSYQGEGQSDYGAHYHIVKLLGWLRCREATDILVEALTQTQPQFQKSRAAAAIALGELGNPAFIPDLVRALQVPIWDLQYGALLALAQLGAKGPWPIAGNDPFVQAKALTHGF